MREAAPQAPVSAEGANNAAGAYERQRRELILFFLSIHFKRDTDSLLWGPV